MAQIDELMNPESGYLVKDGLVLCVEVLECCPWFEFADLDKYASDEEAGASLSESEDSASVSEVTECSTSSVQDAAEPFWMMMGRTGLGIGCSSTASCVIELAFNAWKAFCLPLSSSCILFSSLMICLQFLLERQHQGL